jgi:hypothetical protein
MMVISIDRAIERFSRTKPKDLHLFLKFIRLSQERGVPRRISFGEDISIFGFIVGRPTVFFQVLKKFVVAPPPQHQPTNFWTILVKVQRGAFSILSRGRNASW